MILPKDVDNVPLRQNTSEGHHLKLATSVVQNGVLQSFTGALHKGPEEK